MTRAPRVLRALAYGLFVFLAVFVSGYLAWLLVEAWRIAGGVA